MDFFLLSTTGDLNDQKLCLVEDGPQGMGRQTFRLSRGQTATKHFPSNAKVSLREENPGIKLSGLLRNTNNFLIGSRAAKEVIERLCPDSQIEFLPFTLYNHKDRVHSKDHYFINPLGAVDCLAEKECNIEYDDDGEAISIGRFVLDAGKVAKAPHLFRIDKRPTKYVISKTLGDALTAEGVTNVRGTKMQVVTGRKR
jgi:uncharacterized protein DUF1629